MGSQALLRHCGISSRGARGRLRTRTRFLVFALLLSTVMALAPSASAGVLDQSQPSLSNSAALVSDTIHTAQTFTDGISGSLDQVDLAISRPAAISVPLTVEIRAVSIAGAPSGPVLAAANVPAAGVPLAFIPSGFVSVQLAPSVPVTAGLKYAIELVSATCGLGNCYHWGIGPPGDSYLGGSALESFDADATWQPLPAGLGDDLAFRTYVAAPSTSGPPTSKDQCKNGGWTRFTDPPFKNQGECVAYVNHHDGAGKDDENHRYGNLSDSHFLGSNGRARLITGVESGARYSNRSTGRTSLRCVQAAKAAIPRARRARGDSAVLAADVERGGLELIHR
jgi:hypothetical protein